jgi:hypothetical protein
MSVKNKRDIFRFNGEKPTAINLEHITNMQIEGKRITFTFYTNSIYIDMENEGAAKECFEQLLNVWVSSTEVADVVV